MGLGTKQQISSPKCSGLQKAGCQLAKVDHILEIAGENKTEVANF